MHKIVLITGFIDKSFKYREEIYFKYFLDKKYDIYLFSSFFSPPQKNNKKVFSRLNHKHFRIRSFIKFKDIVIFPLFFRLRKIKPDLIHLFDAQQLVGFIPFLYSKFYSVPFIYEHELRIIPTGIFGRIRFILFTKPLIKLYSNHAALVRTVTPAGKNLILKCFNKNNCEIEDKIVITSLPFSFNDNLFLFSGLKSSSRILNLSFSGKIDDFKFQLLLSILNSIVSIENESVVFHFVFDLNQKQIEKINEIFNKSKLFKIVYHGLLSQEKYLELIVNFDAMLFVSPTISYFEAIGLNLLIFIKSDSTSDHLNSKNIIKYKPETIISDFLFFLDYVRNFFYSTDSQFSQDTVVKQLEKQYLTIIESN